MPKSKRVNLPPLPAASEANRPAHWSRWVMDAATILAKNAARDGAVSEADRFEADLFQVAKVLVSIAPSGCYRRGSGPSTLDAKRLAGKLDLIAEDARAAWRLLAHGSLLHEHLTVIRGHLRRACRLAHSLLDDASAFDERALRGAQLDEVWRRCLRHDAN